MDGWLKWLIILAVAALILHNYRPCDFNTVKNKIPILNTAIGDATCKPSEATSPNPVNATQAIVDLVTSDGPTLEGNKLFYGKPTFDCTSNLHCRDAFNLSTAICETTTGRCYTQNG